jgi:single-strand DNA-binding protein
MAGSVNKVILVGNLGHDPEIRSTNDGREVANFSIATSDTYRDKTTDERRESTEWHKIVIFNEALVNVIKNYVKKGSKVYLEGSIHTRKWTDEVGKDRYSTEILLQNYDSKLVLLDSRKVVEGEGGSTGTNTVSAKNTEDPNIVKPDEVHQVHEE